MTQDDLRRMAREMMARIRASMRAADGAVDQDVIAEQALTAAFNAGVKKSEGECFDQADIYLNNREGAGEPQFGQFDFAVAACHNLKRRIRKLRVGD
jgi:hypothetical protein